jgi:hypothetical protein
MIGPVVYKFHGITAPGDTWQQKLVVCTTKKSLSKRFDVEEFGEVGIISLHVQLHVQ